MKIVEVEPTRYSPDRVASTQTKTQKHLNKSAAAAAASGRGLSCGAMRVGRCTGICSAGIELAA